MAKDEQLKRMPVIETRIFKSKSGKYIVHRTSVTDIKPVEYYDKVMESEPTEELEI